MTQDRIEKLYSVRPDSFHSLLIVGEYESSEEAIDLQITLNKLFRKNNNNRLALAYGNRRTKVVTVEILQYR